MQAIKHNKMKTFGFIAFILGFLDSILAYLLDSGINIGTILPFIFGAIILGFIIFFENYKTYQRNEFAKHKGLFKLIWRIILITAVVFVVSFIIAVASIIFGAIREDSSQASVIMVLGAGVDGRVPSLTLAQRLDCAVDLAKIKPDMKIIVSGGIGPGEDVTEADAMETYLVKKGISKERIIKEDKSTSTYENFKYSQAVYKNVIGQKLNNVLVITSDFHMMRSKFLASRLGIKIYSYSAPTPFYLYPNAVSREYFALFKSFFIDKY